jgi:hypothetical protein
MLTHGKILFNIGICASRGRQMSVLARLCIAAVSLGMGSVGSSQAAPTIVGDHYEDQVNFNCGDTYECRVNFTLTPANKYLLVTYVSCFLNSTKPVYYIVLSTSPYASGGSLRPYNLRIPQSISAAAGYTYSFGQDLAYLIGPSRYPHVIANATTTSHLMQYSCTITGVLKNI